MLRAIQGVAHGEAIFGPVIAQRLLRFFAAPTLLTPPAPFPERTEREREVLALLARGRSNPAIAAQLYLSPETVRNYASNIFSKLQVADRAQAVVRARDAGLGQEAPWAVAWRGAGRLSRDGAPHVTAQAYSGFLFGCYSRANHRLIRGAAEGAA